MTIITYSASPLPEASGSSWPSWTGRREGATEGGGGGRGPGVRGRRVEERRERGTETEAGGGGEERGVCRPGPEEEGEERREGEERGMRRERGGGRVDRKSVV